MDKRKTNLLIGLVILVAVFGGYGIFSISVKNSLVRLDESVSAAWSEIDNQLKRRSDLIPNLVATVKGYASHEQEVFTRIADARSRLAGARTVEEKAAGYNELQSALSRLLVVVENYPVLKANENFTRLMDELSGTENRITVARKRYNDGVREFNTRIRTFPGSLFAGSMGFSSRPYFEIDAASREAPQVKF
ncbi:MAG: LemA family protein [Spirochaetales bacterium]